MSWPSTIPLAVTRSGNTATRFNEAGLLETVNANLPRFDHDPATKARLGILIEAARTNLHLNARNVHSWANKEGVSTGISATGIDGSPTGTTTVVEDSSTGEHRIYDAAVSSNQGAVHAVSVYAKKGAGSRRLLLLLAASGDANGIIRVTYNFDTDTLTTSAGSNGVLSGAYTEPGPLGFKRIVLVGIPKSGGTTGNVIAQCCLAAADGSTNSSRTGDGTSSLILDGMQVEAGDCASSLIVTTSGTVTRNTDNVAMTLTLPLNPDEFTFVAEGMPRNAIQTADRVAASLHDTVTANFVKGLHSPGGDGANAYYDKVRATGFDAYDDQAPVSLALRTAVKHAQRVKDADWRGAWNGTLNGGSVVSTAMPALSTLQIGGRNDANDPWNGWVRRVRINDRGLSDAQLQALSA